MEWINLLENLGIFGLIIAAISWLLKKYLEKTIDKDLEKFKSDLEIKSIEFRIKYEKIYSERIEVMKDVYKKIIKTHKSFSSLMCPLQLAGELSELEKQKISIQNVNDLIDYYDENRIFFDEKLAEEIDFLLLQFKKIWSEFQESRISRECKEDRAMLSQWSSAWNQIDKKIPLIKAQLENRFRIILGINHEN